MTTSIGSITAPTPSPAAASSAAASTAAIGTSATPGLGTDFNTFLKLLTTQLQNQNPLSPLDTNQFTTQLVQFSQVEQAIKANDKLTNLVALQSTDQTLATLPLVGHTVEYSDNHGALVQGKASFNYNLPAAATNATITINDAGGRIVFQAPGETTPGAHSFAWNGKGGDGAQLPDGVYTFNVAATGIDQKPLGAAISALGKVEQVRVDNGATTIDFGSGITEPVNKILAISAATP